MEKFNYGLIAVELNENQEMIDILHFVGYPEPPTEYDIDDLRMEFKDDPYFELQDKWNTVTIIEAAPEIVDQYRDITFECEVED